METSAQYKALEQNKAKSNGVGMIPGQKPLTVRVAPEIDTIVRSLPNRSEFLREAIAEKLEREGLLESST